MTDPNPDAVPPNLSPDYHEARAARLLAEVESIERILAEAADEGGQAVINALGSTIPIEQTYTLNAALAHAHAALALSLRFGNAQVHTGQATRGSLLVSRG